ncbi:MAG TPA: hypothetical protein VK961_08965 [Chthoniobacter sp.]|nr:hypothetical protein [Chthoniobacter sp.]
MRTFLILMALFAAATSHAQTTVRVVRLVESSDAVPVFHVWGGQPVVLALEVAATDPGLKASVRANVYQLAGAIAAPSSKDVPVAEKLSFEHSLAHLKNWRWSAPAVRHPTVFELRFAAQSNDGGDWKPAGSARLIAYPADLGAQLKDLATAARANGAGRLAVFGASTDLKTAFRDLSIPFEDVGEALPDEMEPSSIYIGQCSRAQLDSIVSQARFKGRLMIFANDPTQPPGVYRTDSSGSSVTKVTLPLLLDLAHSPQKQTALLSLLQHAFQTPKNTP